MTKSGYFKLGLAMLFMSGALQFISGIVAGVNEDWMRMALFFTTSVYSSVFFVAIGLSLKMDRSVERIEKLILEKAGKADSKWSRAHEREGETNADCGGG